jgi:serine/threonine protein kinase
MAPEVLRGRGYGVAADWWSAGVMLHELLTGDTPFSGLPVEEIFESLRNPHLVVDLGDDGSTEARSRPASRPAGPMVQGAAAFVDESPSRAAARRNPSLGEGDGATTSTEGGDEERSTEGGDEEDEGEPSRPCRILKGAGRDLVRRLLVTDASRRLGSLPPSSLSAARGEVLDDVRAHPFFHRVDWAMLDAKQCPPPFVLKPGTPGAASAVVGDGSFEYFDGDQQAGGSRPAPCP